MQNVGFLLTNIHILIALCVLLGVMFTLFDLLLFAIKTQKKKKNTRNGCAYCVVGGYKQKT